MWHNYIFDNQINYINYVNYLNYLYYLNFNQSINYFNSFYPQLTYCKNNNYNILRNCLTTTKLFK